MPYLIRILGVTNFGMIAIFMAIIQFINIIIDFGFSFTATRSISVVKNDKEQVSRIFSKTIYAKIIILLFFIFFIGLTIFLNEYRDYYLYYLLGVVFCFFSIFECIWLYQGIDRIQIFANISLISKTLVFISIFYFVNNQEDLIYAFICSCMGSILCGFISLLFILKFNLSKFYKVNILDVIYWLKSSLDIFLANFTISFYTALNIIVVGYFYGPTIAGFFSAADKIRLAAQGLLTPLQQLLFPKVSVLLSQGNTYVYVLKKYGIKVIGFGAFISLMLLLLGYPFCLKYFGDGFELTGKILMFLSPIPFIVSIGMVFGQWFLIGTKKDRILRNVYIIFSSIHLILLTPFILLFKNYGVAISILVTELLISLTFIYFYFKTLEKKT